MWTWELVRARFIEAADIERRMFVKGISIGGNAWPAYLDEIDEKDDEAKAMRLERWQQRIHQAKTPEIVRWEETYFTWTLLDIADPKRRLVVWTWARCIAYGYSFSKVCQERGWVRATAYNRLQRTLDHLANQFRIESRLLHWPDEKWTRQGDHPFAIDRDIEEAREREAAPDKRSTNHPAFISEKSVDTLKTKEAVDAFVAHLEDVNDQRRKALARRMKRAAPEAVPDAA